MDISSILGKFAAMDKSGENSSKIDTYLEYHALGEYLNGNLNTEGFESYNKLDKSQQDLLLKSYEDAGKYLFECCEKSDVGAKITEDNLEEYEKIYNDLYIKEQGNCINESELKEYDYIQRGLYEYFKNLGFDFENSNYKQYDYSFIKTSVKGKQKKEAEMRKKGQVVLDRINNPYDNNLLKLAVEKRIVDEKIPKLVPNKYTVDIGNGEYDKTATQKTELCWAHAGINALARTEEGKNLLELNKYYDPKTGVFAVHLQEAEDNGLHGGVYVITPEEIESEGVNLSDGEGDVTVWMIAIKRYFEEMQQNPELMQKAREKGQLIRNVETGNSQYRFFQIITGAQASKKDLYYNTSLQVGVSYGKNDISYDEIQDLVSNKKGAAVICISGHTMSVIGAGDGKLVIQESNNSEELEHQIFDHERNHAIFVRTEDVNGRPAYELTAHDFEHYNFGEGVIKWK